MTLTLRRDTAVRHQIATLRREFAWWRTRTVAGSALEKHQSQVQKITEGLELLLDRAQGPGGSVAGERARTVLRGAHILWDYFRSKLALRDVGWLSDELKCIDELAWACYEPALKLAGDAGVIDRGRLKEPPLVFFSPDVSPFARTRDKLITAQGLSAADADIFNTAVLSLPISVVGVPWFQHNHLPGAVVVAHEVGHAVANDLSAAAVADGRPEEGVRAQIEAAIAGLGLGERAAAWGAWCHELFADAYAVLCCGPAAVAGLAEYLTDTPARVAAESLPDPERATAADAGWGSYPTRQLRMRFNFELLKQRGLPDLGLRAEWEEAYGTSNKLSAYDHDLKAVAEALLETPLVAFGGKPISAAAGFFAAGQPMPPAGQPFSAARQEEAALAADRLLGNALPDIGTSFRVIFAGITLAYRDNPDQFVARYAQATPSLARRLMEIIPAGVRRAADTLGEQGPAARSAAAVRVAADLDQLLAALSSAEGEGAGP